MRSTSDMSSPGKRFSYSNLKVARTDLRIA